MDDMYGMRYAHSNGFIDICFDDSDSCLVTCGTDGDVRIWNGFDDEDPQSQHMGKVVTAVLLKKSKLYVATDSFTVKAFTFPEIEFENIIAQYNSEVYQIVSDQDGTLIASGGEDFVIKMYNTSDGSLTAFRGHNGAVLSLAFDSRGEYLASSGCDGTFRVWRIKDQECIKTLNILKKSNSRNLSAALCRLSWSPDGKFIAVPVENEVRLYTRTSWECGFVLKSDCISQNTSVVAFSPFGNYVAASTVDGQLVVWNVDKTNFVSSFSHESKTAICSFAWNPSGKDIVFCDVQGQLGIFENALTSSENKVPEINPRDIPIDFECDDDGKGRKDLDDDDVTGGKDVDDDDMNDLDLLHDKDEDNDNAFDIGAIKAELEPKILGTDNDDDLFENASVKSEKPEVKIQRIEAPKPVVQTSFQPSSTPVFLERRFMLWNNVGIIRCYNTEEENSIDVEFHDTSVYHSLHLNNTRNHTMASLSTEALLMACPKADGNPSQLECLHFSTWDSNKEWVIDMPEEEEIESIALGEGFAVCITDKRNLRLFTISGVQCEVVKLPGPVVCSAATGKQIITAYHRGLGIDNDQSISVMMIDVKLGGHCKIRDYPLPLSPKSFLSWLGYTDEGNPCVVDSSGIINILSTCFGVKWIPVANTRNNLKGKSDSYFVLGLSEIKQEVRCILCKGSKYPSLLPRPLVSIIPFALPFCEMSSNKGQLEEENQRCTLTMKRLEDLIKEGFDLDKEYKETEKKWMDILLKMFALSTRMDREYQALNIAELMPNPIIVQGAIRYATQRHRMALAERLGEVMNKKLLAETEDDMEEDLVLDPIYANHSQNASFSKSMRSTSEDTENILKPKPLFQTKHDSPTQSTTSEVPQSDIKSKMECLEKESTPKTSPATNPFKSFSKRKSTKNDESTASSIDSILDNSMKSLLNKSTSSTPVSKLPNTKTKSQDQKQDQKLQTKLDNFHAEPPKPKKYGFPLFLEQNRDSIVSSAESELNETDIVRTAMKMFKELPESEKKKYVEKKNDSPALTVSNGVLPKKADGSSTTATESLDESPPATQGISKRKETDNDENEVPKPKKLKSGMDTTSKKLTQFAFTNSKSDNLDESPTATQNVSEQKENDLDENEVLKPKKLKSGMDTTSKKLTQFAFTKNKSKTK